MRLSKARELSWLKLSILPRTWNGLHVVVHQSRCVFVSRPPFRALKGNHIEA